MAVPALGRVVAAGPAGAGDGALQAAEELDGESGAGLAVGAVGEVEPGQVAQFGHGGVAVEDLAEEQVGGDDGGEGALAVGAPQVAAEVVDQALGDVPGEVGLEAVDRPGAAEAGADEDQPREQGRGRDLQEHPRVHGAA